MAQPVLQQRVCFLETAGEDYVLELVSEGKYLKQIAEILDPGCTVGVTKSLLSRWLSGKLKRNIIYEFELPGLEGLTEKREPESIEQAEARGKKYKEAQELWAIAIVEQAGQTLMEEDNDKMAHLRKAQAEFALRIAGIFNKRYQDQKGSTVAVQVNVSTGDDHLNALRRRRVSAVIAAPSIGELEK